MKNPTDTAMPVRVILIRVDMTLDAMIILALKAGLALGIAATVAGIIAASVWGVLGLTV